MKLYSDAALAKFLDKDIFHQISRAADSLGVECYVVGGYVRDIFLERPSDDIDVVVVGSGIEVAKELKRTLGHKAHLSVFKNFGTAQVKMGDLEVEFVGARRESYSHDSRKPIVEDGTLEDDQNRRDFTINAMAICLNAARFGQLVDPFNGIADLEDGIIATPLDPEVTFSDDPLRMMRCIRFATQLNFRIEEETFAGLQRMADRIKIVSGERIAVELNKIMLSPHPSIGFEYLQRAGLLQIILPEVAALDIVEKRDGRAHKNNFYHSLEVLENVCKHTSHLSPLNSQLWLRWAALLHDVGKTKSKRWEPGVGWTFYNHNIIGAKMVTQIFRRLKLPVGAEMKQVQLLVDLHMRPQVIADSEVTDSAVRRLLNDAGDYIDDLMLLCEADITSKNEVKKRMFLENFRMVREKLADLVEKDYKRLLQPVIDGNEIMEMFHLQPSREVGILKQYLKDAVLDNRVENEREPLMALLMEKARQMGLMILLLMSLVTWGQKSEKIVFTPQWTAQSQFAGYYVAQEKGFYRDAGVEVDIVHPSVTQSAMTRMFNKTSQATTLQLCQALELADVGVELVNILQTSMNNAMVIVSARGKDPLTQKGGRVGVWSVGFGQLAICMSIKEGLDYEWVRFAHNVNLFVSGALDATLAMSYNEYYQLVQAGMELTEKNVYRFCDHGYNVQEDGLYVTLDYYRKHKDQVKRFAQASKKGWEWASAHPEETLDIVMKYVQRDHIGTNRVMQKLMLKEVLRLQVDRESKKREFRLRPDMVQLASRLMKENGMLQREVRYDELTER